MSTATLQLFRCDRYDGVRLTTRSCALRFNQAKAATRTSAAGQALRECRGCDIGKAHAAGESPAALTPTTVLTSEHVGGALLTKRPRPDKACPCGARFSPRTAASVYCSDDCPMRATRKPKKRKAA